MFFETFASGLLLGFGTFKDYSLLAPNRCRKAYKLEGDRRLNGGRPII